MKNFLMSSDIYKAIMAFYVLIRNHTAGYDFLIRVGGIIGGTSACLDYIIYVI